MNGGPPQLHIAGYQERQGRERGRLGHLARRARQLEARAEHLLEGSIGIGDVELALQAECHLGKAAGQDCACGQDHSTMHGHWLSGCAVTGSQPDCQCAS